MVGRSGDGNPTPRVTTCETCGREVTAGRRGPLPRRCEACRADPLVGLRYRIATARTAALESDRADVAAALDRAGEILSPTWTRFGE